MPSRRALIRVEACAVCGTDIKMLDQGHRDLCYPRILGHEVVGRIEEIDRKVQADGRQLRAGELVQVWPGIACGHCHACFRGADNRCRDMKIIGFNIDGGLPSTWPCPCQLRAFLSILASAPL